jgi:hypothetical protein
MIPLAGYAPGVFKVGWLLRRLDSDLKKLEEQLPLLHASPDAVCRLRLAFDKYYRKLPDTKITRPLRNRLAHIMGLEDSAQHIVPAEPAVESVSNPVNNSH